MLFSRGTSKNEVVVTFETTPDIYRYLLDLCKYYNMSKSQVLEALICQDHDLIKLPDKPLNDFMVGSSR